MIPKEAFDEPGVEEEGGHGEVAIVVSSAAAAAAIVTACRGNRGVGGEGARLKKRAAVDMPSGTKRRIYSAAGGEPGLYRPLPPASWGSACATFSPFYCRKDQFLRPASDQTHGRNFKCFQKHVSDRNCNH